MENKTQKYNTIYNCSRGKIYIYKTNKSVQDLYDENYALLMKEIKENLNAKK